jgi:hypothetical protein
MFLTKRRLSSDKIFLMMILLMILGVIGAIVVFVLKKNCPAAVKGSKIFVLTKVLC